MPIGLPQLHFELRVFNPQLLGFSFRNTLDFRYATDSQQGTEKIASSRSGEKPDKK
jgi:hypothetical protein